MDTHTLAVICAVVAALLTPLWLVLLFRGVRTLEDLRNLLRGPVRPRGGRDAG